MPRSKKPPLEDCITAAAADVAQWRERDERFESEQSLFFLKKPRESRPNEEIVVPTHPAYLSEKMTRIISRLGHTVDIRVPDPQKSDVSQLLVNYGRQLLRDWQLQAVENLSPSLEYSMGRYFTQRGWLCARLLACSKEEGECDLPVHLTLHDPAGVYPYRTGSEITRVTHRYKARVDDLKADENLPDVEDTLTAMDSKALVWVYSQYWRYKGLWYHMVWSQGQETHQDSDGWLKKPTEMGYNPWVFSIPLGVPWGETSWDSSDYKKHVGESFFTNMVPAYEQLQKTMSIQATALASTVNPALAFISRDGVLVSADKLSVKPGARMALPPGDLKTIRVGPELQEIIAYIQLQQDSINKAGFSAVMFGESTNIESGYMGDMLRSGGADVTFPYSAALRMFWTQVYTKSIELTGKYWSQPIQVYVKRSANRPEGFYQLAPADMLISRPIVDVNVGELTLQEKLQMISMLSMAVRENLLSMDSARGAKWMNLDDPKLEEQKVMADMMFKDPDMVKTLIPMSLMFLGKDMEQTVFGQLHGSEIAQRLMQGIQNMGQPQAPPGAPQMPQPPGVPGQALSPQAATGVVPGAQSPQMMQMLERLRALMGAAGGAGQGGLPPVGGMPMERVPFI